MERSTGRIFPLEGSFLRAGDLPLLVLLGFVVIRCMNRPCVRGIEAIDGEIVFLWEVLSS